jgi:hypothetical protein
MELLDRYLQAVRRHLPWLRQDDIIAELRANLEAQLEDRQAELGRKLNTAEVEAFLKQLGSPLHVAARYQPQQYLIGPALFPLYRFVLRLAVSWCAVIFAIAKTVEIAANGLGADAVVRALVQLPWILFVNAAVVTLIFALIERSGAKIPEKFAATAALGADWSQGVKRPFHAELTEGGKPRTYAQAVAEVIFGWILLAWLLLVPHYPVLLMGPGAAFLKVTPLQLTHVWWTFYWCVVVLNAAELAWRIVDLVRDRWQGPRRAQKLAVQFFGLAPLLIVLAAPGRILVQLKNPAADGAAYGATLAQINQWAYRGFEVIAVIAFLQLLWMAGQMTIAAYRRRLATAR